MTALTSPSPDQFPFLGEGRGVGTEFGLAVGWASDAGSAADQLCDLHIPLGPCLSSGNTSVVSSLCLQARERGLAQSLAPSRPSESRLMLLSITTAQWPLSPKAAVP